MRVPGPNEEIRQRRAEVSRLAAQHYSQQEIADKFGVAQQTICADMKHVRRAWSKVLRRSYKRLIGEEIAALRAIRLEAWRAWRRSIGKNTTTTAKTTTGGKHGGTTEAATQLRDMNGDPRYLEVAVNAGQRIAKLLRLESAEVGDQSGVPGTPLPGGVVLYIPDNGRDRPEHERRLPATGTTGKHVNGDGHGSNGNGVPT